MFLVFVFVCVFLFAVFWTVIDWMCKNLNQNDSEMKVDWSNVDIVHQSQSDSNSDSDSSDSADSSSGSSDSSDESDDETDSSSSSISDEEKELVLELERIREKKGIAPKNQNNKNNKKFKRATKIKKTSNSQIIKTIKCMLDCNFEKFSILSETLGIWQKKIQNDVCNQGCPGCTDGITQGAYGIFIPGLNGGSECMAYQDGNEVYDDNNDMGGIFLDNSGSGRGIEPNSTFRMDFDFKQKKCDFSYNGSYIASLFTSIPDCIIPSICTTGNGGVQRSGKLEIRYDFSCDWDSYQIKLKDTILDSNYSRNANMTNIKNISNVTSKSRFSSKNKNVNENDSESESDEDDCDSSGSNSSGSTSD